MRRDKFHTETHLKVDLYQFGGILCLLFPVFMAQMDHIDCFRDQNGEKPLSARIEPDRLQQEIAEGIAAAQDTVRSLFPGDEVRHIGNNRSNLTRLDLLRRALLQEFGNPIVTFGELRAANKKARGMVRDAVAPHPEYPDRGMAETVVSTVQRLFIATCKKLHGEIETALAVASKQKEAETQVLRRGLLLREVSDAMNARASNGVAAEKLGSFREFLLCVEEAVTDACGAGFVLRREMIVGHLQTYCDGNAGQEEEFSWWMQELLPDTVQLPKVNGHSVAQGMAHLDAHAILTPRPVAAPEASIAPAPPSAATPLPAPEISQAEPPVIIMHAAPASKPTLATVKWTKWKELGLIPAFLQEVIGEQKDKKEGAIKRVSEKYGIPAGKFASWKEDHPELFPVAPVPEPKPAAAENTPPSRPPAVAPAPVLRPQPRSSQPPMPKKPPALPLKEKVM